jgi:protein-L-isoaspartate(D-aspartate) O-methyltransferase
MYRNKFVLSLVGVSVAGAALGAYFLYRKLTAKYDDDGEIIPKSNKELIKYLKHKRHITQKEVEWVMLKVNRANYVPNSPTPYADQAQPIGFNATISAPHMHAISLEVLAEVIQPGAKVLDVGSGSGYMTACFAMLVGPNGRVYAIDHVKELVEMSLKNIQKDNPQLLHRITTKVGDGMLGWPEHAPYDVIYVGAAAEKMPQALLDQLKPGGRLLVCLSLSFLFFPSD